MTPLPDYIAVRTPSPFPDPQPTSQEVLGVRSSSPLHITFPELQPTGAASYGRQLQSTPTSVARYSEKLSIGISCLERLPGLQLTQKLLSLSASTLRNSTSDFNWMEDIRIPLHFIPMAIIYPFKSQIDPVGIRGLLPDADANSTALTSNFDAHHYLSIAV